MTATEGDRAMSCECMTGIAKLMRYGTTATEFMCSGTVEWILREGAAIPAGTEPVFVADVGTELWWDSHTERLTQDRRP